MSSTIILVPIGTIVEEGLLPQVGIALAEVFEQQVEVTDPLPHPDYAYNERREQYLAVAVLAGLRKRGLPGERVLGIADVDFYAPHLNFVFGQASVQGREAVIALPRLRQCFYGLPDEEELFLARVIKEAVHELGHTYGLGHCPDARCVMHFSNSLHDTDCKAHHFCVACRTCIPGLIRHGVRRD
jgi:archaemetzincin